MNKKLTEIFRKGNRPVPVLTEQAIESLEKDCHMASFVTPLHGLYCTFKDEACGSTNCFNMASYYKNRCIPALCFARWLALKGYARFNFKELNDSIAESLIDERFRE